MRQGRGEAGCEDWQARDRVAQAYRWGAETHADSGWAMFWKLAFCAKSDEAARLSTRCPRVRDRHQAAAGGVGNDAAAAIGKNKCPPPAGSGMSSIAWCNAILDAWPMCHGEHEESV